jgi:hypothetical protein
MSVAMLARKPEADPTARSNAPSKAAPSRLRIGEPNDSFEREADRVADEVMAGGSAKRDWSLSRMSISAPLQRDSACGEAEAANAPGECEQRQENEALQLESEDPTQASQVPPIVKKALSSPGRPLDPAIRNFFEASFGHDFRRVRVHTDADAAASSRAIGARAYATGEQIIFGASQYRPESRGGLHLLAHELSHVVQQSATRQPGPTGRRVAASFPGLIQRQPQTAQQQPDTDVGSQTTATPSAAQLATQITQKGEGGAPSTLNYISFEGSLVAGQTLPGSCSDYTIHTVTDTRVNIYVTGTELSIQFAPGLVISSGTWPHASVELTQVSFNFTKGTFGFGTEGVISGWLAKGQLTSGLAKLFGAMPAGMRAPGYNPLADTNILGNLSSFVSNLSSSSSSPPKDVPAAAGVKASASLTLDGEIRKDLGRMSLVVPKGTNIRVTANLSGGIPSNLRDIRVSSIGVDLWNPSHSSTNVEFHVADAGFPLVFVSSATFSSGGHLQFSYTLVSEVLEAAWRALLGAAIVQSGQGASAGDDALKADQPRAHAFVDDFLHSNLEPLLKDWLLAHRHEIPGIDLGEALGFGPEMGDFPSPQPGAASG